MSALPNPTTPDTLVTTYLEMTAHEQFAPSYVEQRPGVSIMIVKLGTPDVNFYRFLYRTVGEAWGWRDRLIMSDDELRAIITAPGTSIYVLYVDGNPAGYVELKHDDGETEIAYFGLRPGYIGGGLGKHLLSYGIARAWEAASNVRRVWLHTCNLDSPYALSNYMKRGFRIYHVEEEPMPQLYTLSASEVAVS